VQSLVCTIGRPRDIRETPYKQNTLRHVGVEREVSRQGFIFVRTASNKAAPEFSPRCKGRGWSGRVGRGREERKGDSSDVYSEGEASRE